MANKFVYSQPVKIYFGEGEFARLGEILSELGSRRCVIACGRHFAPEAEKLRESLILFTSPRVFTGTDGVEVQHDKEYETMCLMITKETGRDAKRMTVLEYYNAYEYLSRKAKETQKRQNKVR